MQWPRRPKCPKTQQNKNKTKPAEQVDRDLRYKADRGLAQSNSLAAAL